MTTLELLTFMQITLDGVVVHAGSRTPVEITVDGLKHDVTTTVVNSSGDNYNSKVLWDAANDAFQAPIDLLYFESDQDVILELRNDNGTDAFAVIEVKANSPLVLRSAELIANDSGTSPLGADGSATTLDTIDKITVKNNNDGTSATNTATVRLLLIT